MKVLLVYPKYPDTFWSYKHALKFISKKAAIPPLGLLTIAPMLPAGWEKKLIDLNTNHLKNKHLKWADVVMISAMSTQRKSTLEIIDQCKALNKRIVVGGPLFSEEFEKFEEIDHFILNEGEITFPPFLKDFQHKTARKVYQTSGFACLEETPVPDYSLINTSYYSTLCVQFTRGCPFNCEFCNITAMLGHHVRTKTTAQIISELENLKKIGWKGDVMFVDDNFIGNRHLLKTSLLPAMIAWMEQNGNPFIFSTEASINLADDPELMGLLTRAGFASVFVGIETTEEASLAECNKIQNKNRSLIESVNKIQHAGIEVLGGFIVGFDNDTPSVFHQQIDFIQQSGIISAMVGLLNAPQKTRLYQRMKEEGRLLFEMSGNNTDATLNFIPKMNLEELTKGYRDIIHGIYSGKAFTERVIRFMSYFKPSVKRKTNISFNKIMALLKSIWLIGIFDSDRKYYWRLFFWSLFNRPRLFPLAITYSIYGYHFKKIFRI